MIKEYYVYLFMKVIKGDFMNKKLYCFNCNKDVEPISNFEENTYTVHKKNVAVNEKVFRCPFCKNELFDENLDDSLYQIYNEYLKTYGLSFDKLKEIRKSFNLSQDLFAKALGWSKRSVIRYENAESLPQKQNLSIYKKIENNKNEFIKILNNNKKDIGNDLYFKIYNSINAELDQKTINVFLYVLNNNYLTKTQIMKNLFCIDFEFFKEEKKSITSLKYVHCKYGPIIDKKDAYLNFLIQQNYIEIVDNDDDIVLFKPIKEYDKSIFTLKELEIMDKVLLKLSGKSSKELSNWSHKFKGWLDTKDGEYISYSYSKDFELNENW